MGYTHGWFTLGGFKHTNKEVRERQRSWCQVQMSGVKLILEVEKYRELYDPQHMFYKDNSWSEALADRRGEIRVWCKQGGSRSNVILAGAPCETQQNTQHNSLASSKCSWLCLSAFSLTTSHRANNSSSNASNASIVVFTLPTTAWQYICRLIKTTSQQCRHANYTHFQVVTTLPSVWKQKQSWLSKACGAVPSHTVPYHAVPCCTVLQWKSAIRGILI